MSDLLFWLADHVAFWAPFALASLVGFVLLCLYWWSLSWGEDR